MGITLLLSLLLSLLLAYLIGSIPFGLILTWLAGLGDIRKVGSGNIGATNVLRTGNKGLAALTLFLDGFKGAAVVLITQLYIHELLPLGLFGPGATVVEQSFFISMMGAFAVIGHMFPVWLKFKGGKGVATFFGIMLALLPFAGVVALLIWLSTAWITRQSSVAALMATAYSVIMIWVFLGLAAMMVPDPWQTMTMEMPYCDFYTCVAISILVVLIWLKHHENIARLWAGTEPKIGQKT